MSDINNYKAFTCEICEQIKERAFEASKKYKSSNDHFDNGRRLGLNEALSILINEAETEGLDLEELKIAGINTDKDL